MNNKPELTRETFMKNTGLFVSPLYFDMIRLDYKEYKGESPEAFCTEWLKDNEPMVVETELTGKLRYVINDESLTALGNSNVPEVEDLNAIDIIENLCQDEKALREHSIQQKKNYDVLKECWNKVASEFETLKYQFLYLQDVTDFQHKHKFIS